MPVSTSFCTQNSWIKDTQVFTNKEPINYKKRRYKLNVPPLLINALHDLLIRIVFQVNYVAHGPRVAFRTIIHAKVSLVSLPGGLH